MKRLTMVLLAVVLAGVVLLTGCIGTPPPEGAAPPAEEAPPAVEPEEAAPPEPASAPTPEVTYTLSVTTNPPSGGSISLNPANGTYDAGSEITITAAPALGYAFNHWGGDTTGTSSSVTVTMDSDKNVTAHFKAYLEDGIIFQDNFDDDRNHWGGLVKDGVLYIGESAPEGSTYITTKYQWPPAAPDYPDFGYEVEIIPIEADRSWGRGLVFLCRKAPGSNVTLSYVFLISGNGDYKLMTKSEEYHTITDWTVSSHINKGNASNILKVTYQNSIIELYANGYLLESVSGEFPDDIGGNGIGLAVIASGGETIIAFDNLRMWVVTP